MSETRVPDGIRGVSEKRLMPRVGKIHLGIKVPTESGGERPSNVDYFVVPPELAEQLGEAEPRTLTVMFPVNDPAQVAAQNLKRYASGGLTCRGDGHVASAFVDLDRFEPWEREHDEAEDPDAVPLLDVWVSGRNPPAEGRAEWRTIPCLGAGYDGRPPCAAYESRDCSETMHLSVVLPDVPGLGIWQIDTGSYHSIVNVNSFLDMLAQMTGGRIAGIPLVLSRAKREVNRAGRRTTVSILELNFAGSYADLVRDYGIANRVLGAPKLLDAPEDDERPDDAIEAVLTAPAEEAKVFDPRTVETVGDVMTLAMQHGIERPRLEEMFGVPIPGGMAELGIESVARRIAEEAGLPVLQLVAAGEGDADDPGDDEPF